MFQIKYIPTANRFQVRTAIGLLIEFDHGVWFDSRSDALAALAEHGIKVDQVVFR